MRRVPTSVTAPIDNQHGWHIGRPLYSFAANDYITQDPRKVSNWWKPNPYGTAFHKLDVTFSCCGRRANWFANVAVQTSVDL